MFSEQLYSCFILKKTVVEINVNIKDRICIFMDLMCSRFLFHSLCCFRSLDAVI